MFLIIFFSATYRFQNDRYQVYEGNGRVSLVIERDGDRGTTGSIRKYASLSI